ncbi:protein eyes shut homolog [Sturnira hondurensis]|uniref:protein eyes shut homolog n=1 Tax=Sturnira hondurensis TaxID=192404 RepID=UPI001879E558|nr:protein eyes shut homolog [Sturnira hondurensis]
MVDYKILFPIMTNKSVMLLSLLVLHSIYTLGKTICKWQLVKEWHTQPSSYVVNWTLSENICMDVNGDCWFEDINAKMSTSGNNFPQICPLQIQFGDILVISSEPSLQSPEMNLMNVSEASFTDCLQNTTAEEQLLFGCKLKGMHMVHSKWLSVGTHYFITVTASGASLCQLGLRLNVTVKDQFCQEYLSSEYCSGHGKCLTEIWSKTYNCHCEPPFSGKYCQELDACSYKPCKNNGSCINKREKRNKQGYECICHPPFTGINCSEIIDQYQLHVCFHEKWSNITGKSFICECDEPYSGWKRGICQNESSAYICVCPEGLLNQNCETGVSKCLRIPCQIGTHRIDISNDTICICSPKFADKLCKRLQTPCDPLLCKNNATYMNYEKDDHCSCMPRFTGKNCEKVIDHCRLLSIICLNEEWCFNIIGRFRDVCTGNLCWFLKNICLIYLYPCYCRSISHDICQAEVPHSLQLKYVWQLGFTVFEGEKCEATIGAYSFHAEHCTDDAVYVNRSEGLEYLCLFQCEEPMEMRANGCSCLTEEDSQEYFCLCIHKRPRKMNQENTTDYPESGCQPEAVHDEFNISRCSCSLSYIDRFCVLNVGDCFGNQSTSSHGLRGVHLHSCNCSCLQIYKRKICEIKTEDRKSMPCKTEVTSIILSGYFFGTCVPGFRGKYFLRNHII